MSKYSTTNDADRERIIASYLNGKGVAEISSILGLKLNTIRNIIRIYNDTGRIQRKKCGGNHPPLLNEEMKEQIKLWVDKDCSISLRALSVRVDEQYGITVSKNTINRVLNDFHYSLKKISLIPVRRNDEAALTKRREYAIRYIALLDRCRESDFIFLDEFGCNFSMRHRRGRSLTGTRAIQVVPTIRSRNISVCSAMSLNGVLYYKIETRPFNSFSFLDYIKELCNVLALNNLINAIIIMDNVPFHKCIAIKQFIESAGYKILLLPPYSPFLNPIENLFSKWKGIIKSAKCSNEEELLQVIESSVVNISPNDCFGFYKNMFKYISRCLKDEVIND